MLMAAGHLACRHPLRLPLTLLVGVARAVTGDNLGCWAGRCYGRPSLER